jgi:hypothetical protein
MLAKISKLITELGEIAHYLGTDMYALYGFLVLDIVFRIILP